MQTIQTPLTELFGIKHPILLAGMNVAAGPELAAAVTNAGGLGVIGGLGYTPEFLTKQIQSLKSALNDENAPFGVDLLLPQIGGSARKTNYDYTEGKLPELINIIIESKCRLFVSAVGVPPKWVTDKLHEAGIPIMNMVGSPHHAQKAIEAGVDIICAQGGEGGGHTGEIATSILIPAVVDLCKKSISPLTGKPIYVVAAGGIYDGRGLAMSLCLGAQAIWVGTRFVCASEASAPPQHQNSIVKAGHHDTIRTTIFTGRPMRVLKNDYVMNWEENRRDEIKKLLERGELPNKFEAKQIKKRTNAPLSPEQRMSMRPWLMGQVAGSINDIKPAKQIIDEMVEDCIKILNERYFQISSKL